MSECIRTSVDLPSTAPLPEDQSNARADSLSLAAISLLRLYSVWPQIHDPRFTSNQTYLECLKILFDSAGKTR